MTLSAYPGRHSTFDATTVLPQAPPAGAPPGRPAAVDAAFWVAVAASLVSMLGAVLLTVLLASLLVCLVAWSTVLPLLTAVLQTAVLVLLVLPASTAWFRR